MDDVAGTNVGEVAAHAVTLLRYGRMTLATRPIVAKCQSESTVSLPCDQPSRSASSATSRPILLRNLKQSATVLAGLKTGTFTPSIGTSSMPSVRALPGPDWRQICGIEVKQSRSSKASEFSNCTNPTTRKYFLSCTPDTVTWKKQRHSMHCEVFSIPPQPPPLSLTRSHDVPQVLANQGLSRKRRLRRCRWNSQRRVLGCAKRCA